MFYICGYSYCYSVANAILHQIYKYHCHIIFNINSTILTLASEYTTTNAEEVLKARQSERKLADENAKIKADLESVERKRNDLYRTLQQKQQTLDQERSDKNLEKVRLMDKIKDQEQKILKFQCSGNNNPVPPDKGATANPASSSNPFKAVPNKINFQEWTTNIDSTFSSSRESSDPNRNTSAIFRLPKLDLKPFDGDAKKWPDFIAIFRDLVHSNPSLTITEKMAVLKRSLSQEIRNGLGDSLSSPALYSEALQELEATYGHPYIVSRAYFQTITNLPKVNNNDYKTLLKFSQTLNGAISSLKSGGYEQDLLSSGLLETVLSKLPAELQSRWGRKITKSHPISLTLQDFASWIYTHVKGEMMVKHSLFTPLPASTQGKSGPKQGRQASDGHSKYPPSINSIAKKPVGSASTATNQSNATSQNKTLTCLLCKGDHRLASCPTFTSSSLEERVKVIKQHSCCIRCLSKGHISRDCFSKKKCNVAECTAHHHPLLHGAPKFSVFFQDQDKEEQSKSSTPKPDIQKKSVGAHMVTDDTVTLLLIVPVIIEANGIRLNSVGVLDQGSQTSLILQSLSKKLKLTGPMVTSPLATFHGNDPREKVRLVSFNIVSPESGRSFEIKSGYAVPRLQSYNINLKWETVKYQWSHLVDIEPIDIDSSEIGVLLGRNVLRVHDSLETRYPADGIEAPDGIKTHFGWCVTGPVPASAVHSSLQVNSLSGTNQQANYHLHDLVTQFWLTKTFGTRPSPNPQLSHDDKLALKILEKTTRHTGERYEVGLMLRNPLINIPNNREVAVRHYHALQKRFSRDPSFAHKYSNVVNEYISLGHAKIVDENSANRKGAIWYLPHHGVVNPHKPEKVRVVFNPSAPYKGTSLNDQLYKGPDLLTSLIGVLLRFRQFPFPISGDIEKMYHQVLVPHQQQSLFRFLWNDSPSPAQPKEYQMVVHVFGAVSSPSSCIYALKKTTEDFGNRFPTVAAAVHNNIYVDNHLDSTETEEEAIEKIRNVSALLKCGGFNMVQWLSSSRSILATVDQSDLSRSLDLDADKLPIERTLGLLWDCQIDSFTFKSSIKTQVKTKRQVLQEVASVFDPLGFLAPIVMTAKILLQDIWRSGADWDDPLPPTLVDIWTSWANELQSIASLKIPRCFRLTEKPVAYELHVCSDASELGFGAAVYLRAEYPSGTFRLNLLLAKSRVAPLRQLSIPRLELQGAVLGVRLCDSVIKELG